MLLWIGLAVGLGATAADRSLATWGFGVLSPGLLVVVYAVAGPVLTFLGIAGAVLGGAAVVALVVLPRERPVGSEGVAVPAPAEIDAEALPSTTEDVDLAADDFRASYRVDFAGRWGGKERFRVAGADDVRAVVAWAQCQADGRAFEVWVEHATTDGVAQVRIAHVLAGTPSA